ncbi:MAG: hypothetical protein HFH51_13980 [Lachnospiraceae bacterium]|nr:hypothetical protein [Lachnospiraceae bacterium]
MGRNSYPQGQIDDMETSTVQELVTSLKQLHDRGKPETDEEIKQRIDEYFSFCQQSSIRPGIEFLCMALHISRTTLFNWNNGTGELIQSAKSFIAAYIEQALLSGKVSPPSGIFLMKNWLSYKDTVSMEESIPNKEEKHVLTASELPRLGELTKGTGKIAAQLPRLRDELQE